MYKNKRRFCGKIFDSFSPNRFSLLVGFLIMLPCIFLKKSAPDVIASEGQANFDPRSDSLAGTLIMILVLSFYIPLKLFHILLLNFMTWVFAFLFYS